MREIAEVRRLGKTDGTQKRGIPERQRTRDTEGGKKRVYEEEDNRGMTAAAPGEKTTSLVLKNVVLMRHMIQKKRIPEEEKVVDG